MGLLDIYNNSLTQPSGYYQRTLNALDPDLTTQYPNTVTGTPTNNQNPGGPIQNFDPQYDSGNTYIDDVGNGRLRRTLRITNLDVENSGVQGGPNLDITTIYPPTVTGVPTPTANPGGGRRNFDHPYDPYDTYLDNIGTGQLQNTLEITNLDVQNPSVQGGPNSDTTTIYPSTVTGTPTNTQNPGGPVQNFDHPYGPFNLYTDNVNNVNVNASRLRRTLRITNLDVQNPNVDGGPNSDTVTDYPPNVTGTPTYTQNPGGPRKRFDHPYDPFNTYVDDINNNGGQLQNTLGITNLDVEDPDVQGGPNPDNTTQYPASITGVPTSTANPGGPVQNFNHPYDPYNTYLDNNYNTNPNNTVLASTLGITNLDVEDPNVQGGPNSDITTNYPSTITGTPTNTQNPGGPLNYFDHPYDPSNTYINNVGTGQLQNTLDITNLDVENSSVLGGPNPDTTTLYPPLVTGTPNDIQNPGAAPQRFGHPFGPLFTYINNINVNRFGLPLGQLYYTLKITNLDVENRGPLGGPNIDSVTTYPPTVTGTPTPTQNPGGPIMPFVHPYNPFNTYKNTVGTGSLRDTLNITNLDVENASVQGGPKADTITNFSPWVTGTPNYNQNPGAAPQRFTQKWTPNIQYADINPIAGGNSGILYNTDPDEDNSLKITNLDVTEEGVQGGTPYNSLLDPTFYPLTTNHTSPIRGWFSQPSSASIKFYQTFDNNNTYENFISSYI